MKQSGINLVITGAVIAIVCGALVILANLGDIKTGKELVGLVLGIGSSAIVFSLAFLVILATKAERNARNCGTLLIASSFATAILGFVVIAVLVLTMPTDGNYSEFARAIYLTSLFISVFLAIVLIGGVLIRLGSDGEGKAESDS
ncbi:MAG: hypothetical protein OXG08_13885 [Gammaproteobacteria bacterium]|nr:hypothetical protein [Gammaproteobacteria bacterium]